MKRIMSLLAMTVLVFTCINTQAQILQQDYMPAENNIVYLAAGQQTTVSLDSVPSFDTGYVNVYLYKFDSLYNGYIAVPCYSNNGTAILTENGRYKYRITHFTLVYKANGNSAVKVVHLPDIRFRVKTLGMNQREKKDVEMYINQDKE